MKHGIMALAILCILLGWMAQSARAETPMEVQQLLPAVRGLDPSLLPLVVTVESADREIRGELVALPHWHDANVDRWLIPVSIPVTIPPHSRHEFSLPVPRWENFDQIRVELRQGKRVVESRDLGIREHRGLVVFIFSEAQKGAALLGGLDVSGILGKNYNGTVAPVYANPNALPHDWRVLKGASLVVLDDFPLEKIPPETEEALIRWVLCGGRMVLFPQPLGQRASSRLVRALVPEAFIARLQGHAAGNYLSRPFGMGRVVLVAPRAAEAFWSQPAKQAVWLEILREAFQGTHINPLSNLTSTDSKRITPRDRSVLWLFFIVYLAVVGPFQYMFLKRKGMLGRLLLGTALCSVTFSIFFSLVAVARMGTRAALLEYAFILLPSGESQAGAHVQTVYFSARERSYAFQGLLADPLTLPQIDSLYGSNMRLPGRIRLEKGFLLEDYKVPMWGEARFRTDGVYTPGGTVRIAFSGQTLHVENQTGLTLRDAHLSVNMNLYSLGDIGPGTRDYPVSTLQHTTSFRFADSGNGGWGAAPDGRDRRASIRADAGQALTRLIIPSALSPSHPVLAARLEPSPSLFEVRPGRPGMFREALLVVTGDD